MADDVEENNKVTWSETLAETLKNLETTKNTSEVEVSPSKIPDSPVEQIIQFLPSTTKVDSTHQDRVLIQPNLAGEKMENHPKNPFTPKLQKPFKSNCHPRSRDLHQCQKHIQDIIGKHEIRNEELELLEGDLRQRLQALESSMPAVMVWNIWRKAQGAPTSVVRRLMEKQFEGFGGDNFPVPITPSQHWDERVRKIEAERKEALRRVEEARVLLAEKEAAVHERGKRLEGAKKCHQERKEMMEKLAQEAAKQREALMNAKGDDNSGKSVECGDIRKEKWLDAVCSVGSIGSTDLESFSKLQELAEAEICMKRQISELERREEAYMRTLQQADEMWSKMEGDTADTVSLLQDQLDLKTTANQQLADRICQLEDELEISKKKLISSIEALSEFTSKDFSEAKSGNDDSEANVEDRGVLAAVKTVPVFATAKPDTFDQESLAHTGKNDKESYVDSPEKSHVGITAFPKMTSETSEAIPVPPDQTHHGVDPLSELKTDATHRGTDPPSQVTIDIAVGGNENIPEHWKNWDWTKGCPPDIPCDAMVESATQSNECQLDGGPKGISKVQSSSTIADHAITEFQDVQIAIPLEELRNWYNIVDSVHHTIAKGEDCSSKTDDVAQLAVKIKSHLKIKNVAGVKEPMIISKKILQGDRILSGEHMPEVMTPSGEDMLQEINSPVRMDGVDYHKPAKSNISEDEKEIDTKRVPLVRSTANVQKEIKTTVPTNHINLRDETEPHYAKVEPNISAEISPVTLTTEELLHEKMLKISMDHVEKTEPKVPEVVAQVNDKISSPTQLTDEIQRGINTKDLIDHKDLFDETKSPIHEEVAKTDKDISPVIVKREKTESSDVLIPSEKGGRPEVEDVDSSTRRVETTDISARPMPADVKIESSGKLDEIQDAVTSEIDELDQKPAFTLEKLPQSLEESPRVKDEAEADVVAHVADANVDELPAAIANEHSLFVARKETAKQSEFELPDSLKVKTEFEEIQEPPEMISPAESVYSSAEDVSEAKSGAFIVPDEPSTIVDLEEESTHMSGVETLIEMPAKFAEEAEEMILLPKDDELKLEEADEPIELLDESLSGKDKAELPLKLEVFAEEDATIEEAPPSFITPRTPPLSQIDVKKESKDEIVATFNLKDDQLVLDLVHEKRSSEVIVGEEIERLLLSIEDVPVETKKPMPDLDIPQPVLVEPEKSEKVSITRSMDYEQRSEIIDAQDIPKLEVAISEAESVKADSETKLRIPEAGSQSDIKETKQAEDKLVENISTKEKVVVDRPKARKPYLAIAKVESWKNPKLPKPVGPCICEPQFCPMLGRSTERRPKMKVVEVVTSGTQTISASSPKTLLGKMGKQKPKKFPEKTSPSSVVATWRRATISPRRPNNKSTLTTVCVETQTDRTNVRERIALLGISRKDDCTCSGVCARKPDHGGCIQRIFNKPTREKRCAPISLSTAQLLSPTNFTTSMTSCAEKEICVVKYSGRSVVPSGRHLDCIECGRPITPEGTVVFQKSTLPTTSTSQSIIKSLTSMAYITGGLPEAYSKNGLTCYNCKTSGKLKTNNDTESKRQDHKDLDKRRHDQGVYCPCPPKVAKKTSSKLSKKKRKPEMKDQSVMANIPKNALKASPTEVKGIDVIEKKSTHGTLAKTKPSDSRPRIASEILSPGKESYCSCDESNHKLSHSGVQSIADSAKTIQDTDPCNCFLMESVSRGSSCNCFDYHI